MTFLSQSPHFRLAQTGFLRQQPVVGNQVQKAPGDPQPFFSLAFLSTFLPAFLSTFLSAFLPAFLQTLGEHFLIKPGLFQFHIEDV
jgi:hypothetical protein